MSIGRRYAPASPALLALTAVAVLLAACTRAPSPEDVARDYSRAL